MLPGIWMVRRDCVVDAYYLTLQFDVGGEVMRG